MSIFEILTGLVDAEDSILYNTGNGARILNRRFAMKHMKMVMQSLLLLSVLLYGCTPKIEPEENTSSPRTTSIICIDSADNYIMTSSEEITYKPWQELFGEDLPEPEAEMQIEFNGHTYKGDWTRSEFKDGNDHRTDCYHSDSGPFEINAETKELEFIGFRVPPNLSDLVAISFDQASQIAINIAAQYINVEEYVLQATNDSTPDNPITAPSYSFTFTRWIDDIKCWDLVKIVVLIDGSVHFFYRYMTTEFQQYLENTPDAEIHQIVSQLGSSSVESDIRELEKKMSKSPDWRTDIFDKMLVLLVRMKN